VHLMYDAFISYAFVDRPVAEKLCDLLELHGIRCWMAPRDIPAGAHYAGSISQAVRNAKLLFLLFSRSANDSKHVIREVDLAVQDNLSILPLMLDDTPPNDAFRYYLSIEQHLMVPGKNIESIAEALIPMSRRWIDGGLDAARAAQPPVPPEDALLDIYDGEMDWIGSAKRNAVHREGFWHKSLHCWFVGESEGRPFVYFQRRSGAKREFPGLADITAGRHLLSGETDQACVGRVWQELGVDARFDDLRYVGIRTYTEDIDAFHNQEYNSVYLYHTELSLRDFMPDEAEASGILRVFSDDGLKLFSGECDSVRVAETVMENGRCVVQQHSIKTDDFVPRKDDYYLKVFGLARDALVGKAQLSL
jgi:isopentenyldiphosphate isomerase